MDKLPRELAELIPLAAPSQFAAFPYTPYGIQNDLMRAVYEACEKGKVAVMESPTGTGKSLSLIVSSLTWLRDNAKRARQASLEALRAQLTAEAGPNEPAWVLEHTLKIKQQELDDSVREMDERLEEIRKKEEKIRRQSRDGPGRSKKKPKIQYSDESEDDDDGWDAFLPDDDEGPENGDTINAEARAMIQKFDTARKNRWAGKDVDDQPDTTKIFYTSRTHSQLAQFTEEILKTPFSSDTRTVPLGSRKNLCINDAVRKGPGGDAGLNERCRELRKAGSKKRCEFLPGQDEQGKTLDFRDHALASIHDIQDLENLGRRMHVCPYYGSRAAVRQAELCTLPYNLLLSSRARESLGISLKDHIVIIDEAHNLIDTILSVHACSITLRQVSAAAQHLTAYLARYGKRLSGAHAVSLKLFLRVLAGLAKFCKDRQSKLRSASAGKPEEMCKPAEVLSGMGNADSINLETVEKYLRESKIAQKISGFADKLAQDASASAPQHGSAGKNGLPASQAAVGAMHQIQAFLVSLAHPDDDGRVLVSLDDADDAGDVRLSYQLLNGASHFKQIVDDARAVIMAGGTMHPINDFRTFLMPELPLERFTTLSCSHVIPTENLLTTVVCKGPKGVEMDLRYETRSSPAVMDELGAVVQNLCNLAPDGCVVFFPSYGYLAEVEKRWNATGLISRLDQKKTIFREPKETSAVQLTLDRYAEAIAGARCTTSVTQPAGTMRKTGALLLAVVGAKLSEGINFSNELARCVVMVGLPFASPSASLEERKAYVRAVGMRVDGGKGPDRGAELIVNQTMRAVNQSIGRAIRHANDWAGLVLVDKRYASSRIAEKLPKWIGESVKVAETFPEAVKVLAPFYSKRKKSRV